MLASMIEMDPGKAKELFLQFRHDCKGNPTDEDQAIMMGYKSLMKGHAIIDLHGAIRGGGVDEKTQSLPRLAVGRANWTECFFEKTSNELRFSSTPNWIHHAALRRLYGKHRCTIPASLLPIRDVAFRKHKAMVPFIPPSVRPSKPEDYFVLWEAVW